MFCPLQCVFPLVIMVILCVDSLPLVIIAPTFYLLSFVIILCTLLSSTELHFCNGVLGIAIEQGA